MPTSTVRAAWLHAAIVVAAVCVVGYTPVLASEHSHSRSPRLAPLLGVPVTFSHKAWVGPHARAAAVLHLGGEDTAEVMVVFEGEAAAARRDAALEEVERYNADASLPDFHAVVKHTFRSVPGLAGRMSVEAIDFLRGLDGVRFVEFDAQFQLLSHPPLMSQGVSQFWNLDRSDQTYLPMDDTFTFRYNGSGVDVYVVDSGVRVSHTEFEGRAIHSSSVVGDASDCNGHGTHVAGIVGGRLSGVAKGVTIYAVKVLGCSSNGDVSSVVTGLDNAITEIIARSPRRPTVINLSLGAGVGVGTTLTTFAETAVGHGITVIAAAGNSQALACGLAPAVSSQVLTVASVSELDWFSSSFSNHGSCVDLLAPGSSIVSSSRIGDTTHEIRSGTSMAAPYVAGLAAQYLSFNASASPQQVKEFIECAAIPDVVRAVPPDTPNLLALSLTSALVSGTCRDYACSAAADCSNHGSCIDGTCVCHCGHAGFDCGYEVGVTNLASASGTIDGSTTSAKDFVDDFTKDAMFTVAVPQRGSLRLALCDAATSIESARLLLLDTCPTHLNSSALTPVANTSSPYSVSCDVSGAESTPLEVANLTAGTYTVVVTSTALSGGVLAGSFRLAWNVSEPTDKCQVGPWSNWTACNETCGYGVQTRSRSHISGLFDDICPPLAESRECIAQPCGGGCTVTPWSEWSTCSATCEPGGERTRTRTINDTGVFGGSDCPPLADSEPCNNVPCRGCTKSDWSAWSGCLGSCGSDTHRLRNRTVVSPATDSSACDDLADRQSCTPSSCVLVVVMFDVQGAQVLTAAVTQAVQDSMVAATADVVALNAATIVVEVAGNGGAEARRLANSVLSLQCTIPVPSVSEGKAVVAAAQTSVADGDVAAAVSLSVGGGSVSVIMPAAHVTTQDGTQITANLIKDPAAAEEDDDTNIVLLGAVAFAILLGLCICVVVVTCCCGDHAELKVGRDSNAVTRIGRRSATGQSENRRRGRGTGGRVDLNAATKVVAVGPSSVPRPAVRPAPKQQAWHTGGAGNRQAPRASRPRPPPAGDYAMAVRMTQSQPARSGPRVSGSAWVHHNAASFDTGGNHPVQNAMPGQPDMTFAQSARHAPRVTNQPFSTGQPVGAASRRII